MIVAKAKAVLANDISSKCTECVINGQDSPILFVLLKFCAQALNLFSDKSLEVYDASFREERVQNASAKLMKVVARSREDHAVTAYAS